MTVRRRIAFLHTASSNIGIFETALGRSVARASWTLRHEVRPDLLAAIGFGVSIVSERIAEMAWRHFMGTEPPKN